MGKRGYGMSTKVCHVYMKKDLEKVGMAGQLVKATQSFADNFLIPRGYAVFVHEAELASYEKRNVKKSEKKEVLETKTSMLAERIKSTPIVLHEKTHDGNKLYGSIKEGQIVDALKEKGILVSTKQVIFEKSVKTVGEYKITNKLSSSLRPELSVKVASL